MPTVEDQPPPTSRPDATPVWNEVIQDFQVKFERSVVPPRDVVALVLVDMRERDQLGRERYGMPLTTYNGRDHVVDAYQEMLDAAVYMKAAMIEDDGVPQTMYMRLLDDVAFLRQRIEERRRRAQASSVK
jgi:hypothetical protein